MKFRYRKEIVIILLALVVCLGLSIWGTVAAGSSSTGFVAYSSNDPEGTIDPGKDKDIGCTTCELKETTENSGYEKVAVTITNAYPGYNSAVTTTIKNHGTTVTKITSIKITAPSEISVSYTDLVGAVLDPGQEVEGVLEVSMGDNIVPTSSYSFTVEVEIVSDVYTL